MKLFKKIVKTFKGEKKSRDFDCLENERIDIDDNTLVSFEEIQSNKQQTKTVGQTKSFLVIEEKENVVNCSQIDSDIMKRKCESIEEPKQVPRKNLSLQKDTDDCPQKTLLDCLTNRECSNSSKRSRVEERPQKILCMDIRFESSRTACVSKDEVMLSLPEDFITEKSCSASNTSNNLTERVKHQSDICDDYLNIAMNGEGEDYDVDVVLSKVRHNRVDEVRALLESGLDVNIMDKNGNTMLHVCAQNNLRKMASLLFRWHCKADIRNKKGMTPLEYANLYQFHQLADYLRSKCF